MMLMGPFYLEILYGSMILIQMLSMRLKYDLSCKETILIYY